MTNAKPLAKEIQEELLKRLPKWKKFRTVALYRETCGFVQWISFQTSIDSLKVRPSYSVQCLATKFPTIALTLGDFVRSPNNAVWISKNEWLINPQYYVDLILNQTMPWPHIELTTQAISSYLANLDANHVSLPESRGVSKILIEEYASGRLDLNTALNQYRKMKVDWALECAAQLEEWLLLRDEALKSRLETSAEEGKRLLGLS